MMLVVELFIDDSYFNTPVKSLFDIIISEQIASLKYLPQRL